LGHKDDIVKVKNGYATNYLIPQGFAVVATEPAKKQLAEDMKQRAHKLTKLKADAEALAAQINGVTLTIGAKASTTGKIFGSVTTIQLAEGLAQKGIEVDRKQIALGAVKELGSYKATVVLHREVSAEFSFDVVAE
jgi:large subunit ribosomal protein L9